jgi:hypothetical protein
MDTQIKPKETTQTRTKSRMPEDSFFFEKAVPVLLTLMGIVMIGLMLFAAGVLLGLVSF